MTDGAHEEDFAVNVTEEAASAYYKGFSSLPESIKKKVSCYMLAEIFKSMVIPALDHARKIGRTQMEGEK
jgi:hypothetical protein